MKKPWKSVLAAGLALGVIVCGTTAAQAESTAAPTGGWSEESGSFTNASSRGISTFATPKHTGKAENKTINGTSAKRSHGWTTWAGTRHYTTAQLEHTWPSKGVITTSGRQWGTGGTEAVTKYVKFDPNAASNGFGKAKTYYGK